MLRRVVVVALCLATALGAYIAWDFIKLGRKPPAMAASEQRANLIRVDKQARQMTLLRDGQPIKSYQIALGGNPVGPKQREGDSRTPEGRYFIDSKNARSRFHLALHVSYPSAEDKARAAQDGVPPGSDIMIHGLPNGLSIVGRWHLKRDWTDGCVAVTNREMEEIWALVDTGTSVEINP